jgi:hypothetical protein
MAFEAARSNQVDCLKYLNEHGSDWRRQNKVGEPLAGPLAAPTTGVTNSVCALRGTGRAAAPGRGCTAEETGGGPGHHKLHD